MLAVGVEMEEWSCTDVMQYVLSTQKRDGSFRSVGGTIQILPVLIATLPHDVAELKCPSKVSE